jgi:hypothetical protein
MGLVLSQTLTIPKRGLKFLKVQRQLFDCIVIKLDEW